MFHLIEPNLGRISGGLRYNRQVAEAADGLITRHSLDGNWAEPRARDIDALHNVIAACNGPVLLDGLIGCSLSRPLASRLPVVILVHALAETVEAHEREAACLGAADAVIATSDYAANELRQRHGVAVTTAIPGVAPRRLATGGGGGNFICVGALEPNKNQAFLAAVLTELLQKTSIPWRCIFAGPATNPAYARNLAAELQEMPAERGVLAGELDEPAMHELYDRADLLLLPSRAETFGLVVREASAAGIPAFVTAGTGAEESLSAGHALPLDNSVWVDALSRWLKEPQYRQTVHRAAQDARQNLDYGWETTAHTILDVLDRVTLDPG